MSQNFPPKFIETVLNDPFLEGEKLLDSLDSTSPIAVRFNPFKQPPTFEIKTMVPWCENAFFLN
jgi:hypothetical protein